jgi:excisionase family DNA binding protein
MSLMLIFDTQNAAPVFETGFRGRSPRALEMKMRVDKSSKSHVLPALELATYLRIHPTTVYKLAKRGELPAFKVGGDWRFNRASIEKWLESRKNRFPDNPG